MTLLTQRLNSSVKNADWSVKREKYKGTKLFITQELVGIDQISPSVIVARTVKILDTIRMDLSLPSSKELKIFAQEAKVNDIKLSHKNKSKVLAMDLDDLGLELTRLGVLKNYDKEIMQEALAIFLE